MPVNTPDPAWTVYTEARKKVADLFEGRETALSYIRPMPGHDAPTQLSYAAGAYFLPLVAKTIEAFGGLVFAKTPTRSMPDAMKPLLSDVTGTGQDIDRFAEQAFDGVLLTGDIAVLVDFPAAPDGMTKAESEAQGIRPTLALYGAGAILSARFRDFGPARKLAYVRLAEVVEEDDPADEFTVKVVEQIRVLSLDDAGLYRQRVFRQTGGGWTPHGDEIEPRMAGQRLSRLPIFFANPRDGEPRPAKPPVEDIADINIAHLNNSAALEWALLWTANPTPVFAGLGEGVTEVKLGSSEGIVLAPGGDAKFMEFTGAGLSELRLALEAKRKDAALMGARMLLEGQKAAIAAETARIGQAGEASVVTGIANSLSDCLTKALAFMAEWASISGEVEYWLNTNINPAGLSPQMLAQYLDAWLKGALTDQELFALLQVNEVIDPAKTFDEHVAEGPDVDSDAEGEASLPPETPQKDSAVAA